MTNPAVPQPTPAALAALPPNAPRTYQSAWQWNDDETAKLMTAEEWLREEADVYGALTDKDEDDNRAGIMCAIAKEIATLRAERTLWAEQATRLIGENAALLAAARHGAGETEEMERKAALYDRINTPEVDDFLSAVRNEALHQRERWSVEHDGGKEAADWFWLVGYLAGKALHDVKGKRLHHIITAAAALLNWHGKETGHYAAMRPGIADPAAARAAHPEGPQHAD